MATALSDELPPGFAVDDLPAGFKVDAPSSTPRTGAGAVPSRPGANTAPTPSPASAETGAGHVIYGAVQAALNTVAGMFGGGAGLVYGGLEAAGQNAQDMLSGRKPSMDVEQQAVKRAQQFTPELPQALQTETGREYTGAVSQALQEHGASVIGIGPELALLGRAMKPAARGVGDLARAGVDATADAVTPKLEAGRQALAKKAVDAGIPINLHQLSDNGFGRKAGELSESIPLTGSKRAQRQSAFTQGIIKAIDPESTHEKLTPDTFVEIQDKAGSEIGEISARTPVPRDALGDINSVARRDTPDVQGVIRTYADDFQAIADANDGIIPGTELRKMRSEVQRQARSTSNGDLRNTLGNLVHKIDNAISEHAADGDMPALLDARRRYAISTAIEPLVAKSPNGEISPAGLMGRVTASQADKHRMARGKGGELGDYARIGQQFLKEQASSGTAERHLAIGAVLEPLKTAGALIPANLYNRFGPRVAKWIVERNAKMAEAKEAPTPSAPPEPTLGQGFEPPPAPRDSQGPLGDLTPDWETVPGAAPEPPPAMSAEGLVPAVGDDPVTTGRNGLGSRLQIPAVEGRPDLPDALTTGAPAESAATARANEAMVDPGAIEARRQQAQAEVERAAAAERAEPVPVGEATEITPQNVKPAGEPRVPAEKAEKLPVGEATEIKPEAVEPAKAPEPQDPRLAEIERLKLSTDSPAVRAALDKRAEAVKKELKVKAAAEKKASDAAELRAAAEKTADPDIKASLLAEAEKLNPKAKNEASQTGTKSSGKGTQSVDSDNGSDRAATPAATGEKAAPSGPGKTEASAAADLKAADEQRLRTGDLQPEARQEGAQEGGAAKPAQESAPDQEALSVADLPRIDEAFMREQERAREATHSPPPERGVEAVRQALADPRLNKDGAALALWALDRNPNLARGLKVELADPASNPVARGSYNAATEVVKLFASRDNPLTAAHEILHHSERMMPPSVQKGIRREWLRGINKAIADAETWQPEVADALRKTKDAVLNGDKRAFSVVKEHFQNGTLNAKEHYHLVDPSEYWAVKASEILNDRFTGRGSWRAEAKQWLSEMVEHVKGAIGLRSDAPLLKALDRVLNPDKTSGERQSKRDISSNGKPPKAKGDALDVVDLGATKGKSLERLEQMAEALRTQYTKGDLTYAQWQERFDALQPDIIEARRKQQAHDAAAPAKNLREVYPGFKQIPVGTKIVARHGLKYKEYTEGKVTGTKTIRVGKDAWLAPEVDFGDGVPRAIIPSDIKDVFAPRSAPQAP